MRYKDVVREQILHAETAEDAISSDEEDGDGNRGRGGGGRNDNGGEGRRGLAYDEEQERLRKGFLGMVAEHDDGGSGGGGGGENGGSEDGEGSSGEDGEGLLKVCAPCFGLCRVLFLCVSFFFFCAWCLLCGFLAYCCATGLGTHRATDSVPCPTDGFL